MALPGFDKNPILKNVKNPEFKKCNFGNPRFYNFAYVKIYLVLGIYP